MDVFALVLALVVGVVQAVLAVLFVVLPLKVSEGSAPPGCMTAIPPLALIPMTMFDSALFLFLKAEGTFVQKFGLAFGGTTIFAIAIFVAAIRASGAQVSRRAAYYALAYLGLLVDFALLFGLANPGTRPVLTVDPILSVLLCFIGLPAAMVGFGLLVRGRPPGPLVNPPKTRGDVTYLPPRE